MNRATLKDVTADEEEYSTTLNHRIELQQVPNSSSMEIESGDFPSDVVIEILSRPVKSLFRFKSVCTNWDAMIPTNPHLVSMHLKNYNNGSLFCNYVEKEGSSKCHHRSVSLCLDGQPPTHMDESLLQIVICGTGNGLFLLGHPDRPQPDYRLWNPATREIRPLPDPPLEPLTSPSELDPFPHLRHSFDYCGVGEDLEAKDIKVVLIRNYVYLDENYKVTRSSVFSSPIFVYILRNNCWRKLPVTYYPYQKVNFINGQIYFRGLFYWLVPDFVVAFDMSRDVLHRINCPFEAFRSGSLDIYGGD